MQHKIGFIPIVLNFTVSSTLGLEIYGVEMFLNLWKVSPMIPIHWHLYKGLDHPRLQLDIHNWCQNIHLSMNRCRCLHRRYIHPHWNTWNGIKQMGLLKKQKIFKNFPPNEFWPILNCSFTSSCLGFKNFFVFVLFF